MSSVPLITAVAAFGYAAAVVVLLLSGGQLPFAVPAASPGNISPGGLPTGMLTYLLPVSAVIGGWLAAAIHARKRPPRFLAAAATAFGGAYTAVVLLFMVDSQILSVAGYIPFLLFKAIFDPAALQDLDVQWAVLGHQLVLIAGIVLWLLTAATAVRKAKAACVLCGRNDDGGRGWFSAAGAARWSTPVTVAAAIIPAAYAVVRFAWAVGIPLGIEDAFLRKMQETGATYSALGLASMALLGAVLTLGLIQKWGSAFPKWVPVVGGRQVPVLLAVIPAVFVSIIVVAAGVELIETAVSGMTGGVPFDWNNWGTLAPAFLWPLWGPLLAASALAYYLKRRGSCSTCGRDN
ncbi:hypothetical protein GCM10027562_06230 [Arthrobacter pigmenti]